MNEPVSPNASPSAGRAPRRAHRWPWLLLPALAMVISGCGLFASPPPLEVTYRIEKADAAFVNSVRYRNANGDLTQRTFAAADQNTAFPWIAIRYFEFGDPVSIEVQGAGSPAATATVEVIVKRSSTGTEIARYTDVCDSDPCTVTIQQTLASSSLGAAE